MLQLVRRNTQRKESKITMLWQVKTSGCIYFSSYLQDANVNYHVFCKTSTQRRRLSRWNFISRGTASKQEISMQDIKSAPSSDDPHLHQKRLSSLDITEHINAIGDENLQVVISGPFQFVKGMVDILLSNDFPSDRIALLDHAHILGDSKKESEIVPISLEMSPESGGDDALDWDVGRDSMIELQSAETKTNSSDSEGGKRIPSTFYDEHVQPSNLE